MSKRRRGKAPAQVVQTDKVSPMPKPARLSTPAMLSMMAQDGFINRLAYLGEASDLSAANDYERHSISRDFELLTVMYRENWIAKRIIDTPCEDMTRSWYSISTALNQTHLDELEKLEARHNVKQEITNGLRWARLFGGAAAVMVIKGQEDMLEYPLDYDDLMPGCFRGLIVVDRTNGLDPSVELEDDMDDPEFGYPKYYNVRLNNTDQSIVRVHHSRLLVFRGRMLPITEEMTESYWGASELEHVYEELQKRNATSANIAQLIFQANVGALKMADYGETLGMGTENQKQQILDAIYTQNRIRNSFGMMIMSNEDSYEQHAYSFSGLSEIYETFMMDMAGAAEIPATKLFGRSPQGMNATGESDMKNYYEMLSQLQERNLRPAIEKLLPVMAVSLWGKIPNDMKVVFEPLQVTTPDERAQIMQQVTGVVVQAFSAGLISQQTALTEMQKFGKDIGFWDSITEELIEKADAEVDQGEGQGDPMGGMGGMGGDPAAMMGGDPSAMMGGDPSAMTPPEGPEDPNGGPGGGAEKPEEGNAPQEPQNGPEQAPDDSDDEVIAQIMKEAQGGKEAQMGEPEESGQETGKEEAEDGGPGSGNFGHPGYRRGGGLAPGGGEKKAGLGERLRFIQDPTEGKNAPRGPHQGPTGSKTHVENMNRERKQWGNLTTHQKVQGSAEQQKHMAKMKADVVKAAAKGDLDTARKIVRANRHYFSNDPTSAQKVQSETLKRQKAVKPRRFFHDAMEAIRRPFSRRKEKDSSTRGEMIKAYAQDHSNAETADFILRIYGADEEAWRTNEEGNHFKLETSTGEIKAGFGGKFNGKKIGEEWEPGKAHKPRKTGSKVAAPAKTVPEAPTGRKVPMSFTKYSDGRERVKEFAARQEARYEDARKNAEKVLSNPAADPEDRDNAVYQLAREAGYSDAWNTAKRGEVATTSEFGLEKMPKEWAERLSPREQEVLSNIFEESNSSMDYRDIDQWKADNPDADRVMSMLQAKLLGAEIEPELSDDILEKYAGIEKRVEVPGQQSMFYGENVPTAQRPESAGQPAAFAESPASYDPEKNSSERADNGSETRYNESGVDGGFEKAEPQKFLDTFHAAKAEVAKARPEDAWRVDSTYTTDDYAGMDCYTTPGGSAVAVHDGDIVSVCGKPGDKVRGSQLLQHALKMGGKKLDAFGGLYGFYAKNGFEPVSWCEFDERYAPDDWKKGRDDPEPVIFWKHTGRSYEDIVRDHGKTDREFTARVKSSPSYDDAKAERDKSMEE